MYGEQYFEYVNFGQKLGYCSDDRRRLIIKKNTEDHFVGKQAVVLWKLI